VASCNPSFLRPRRHNDQAPGDRIHRHARLLLLRAPLPGRDRPHGGLLGQQPHHSRIRGSGRECVSNRLRASCRHVFRLRGTLWSLRSRRDAAAALIESEQLERSSLRKASHDIVDPTSPPPDRLVRPHAKSLGSRIPRPLAAGLALPRALSRRRRARERRSRLSRPFQGMRDAALRAASRGGLVREGSALPVPGSHKALYVRGARRVRRSRATGRGRSPGLRTDKFRPLL